MEDIKGFAWRHIRFGYGHNHFHSHVTSLTCDTSDQVTGCCYDIAHTKNRILLHRVKTLTPSFSVSLASISEPDL